MTKLWGRQLSKLCVLAWHALGLQVESSGIHDWKKATNNPLVIKYNYGITTHLSCYSLACNQEQHYCNIYYSQKYSEIYESLERKALLGESIYKHYLAIKRVLSLRAIPMKHIYWIISSDFLVLNEKKHTPYSKKFKHLLASQADVDSIISLMLKI